MDHPPDADIVATVLAGDRTAFGTLVGRYQDKMMAYAVHMGCDRDQAADVVQEGMVRAYRHLARCGDPERFAGWLFRIVANQCRTELRRRGKRRSADLGGMELAVPGENPGPDRQAEASSTRRKVTAALEKLSPDQREALVLNYLQGHSLTEMVALTGASPSALKMRLKRGRDALRAELAPLFEE